MEKDFDVGIIGRGVAGLSAGIYSARLGLKFVLIGNEPGGTLLNAAQIENYPGFSAISGKGLIQKIEEQLGKYNPLIIEEGVQEVLKKGDKFLIKTKKKEFSARAIIFCSGSKWKEIDVAGEKEFRNKGVHYCALCDGFFYKDKTIAVIGGGDSAVKEAILLSNYAKKTYLITRDGLKAELINLEKVKEKKNIEVLENFEVKEIRGDKFVNSVVLDKKYNSSEVLALDGVFIEAGREPNSKIAISLGVNTNERKEIITDKESRTNVSGIYAAGDVTDTKLKQAITGVGDAVKAAFSAHEYVSKKEVPILTIPPMNFNLSPSALNLTPDLARSNWDYASTTKSLARISPNSTKVKFAFILLKSNLYFVNSANPRY